LTDELSFKQQKIIELTCAKKQLHGYHSNFGNVTWEEFIWADQCFIDKNYKMMLAVLYRQKRPDYTGENDIRIPFSTYSINKRIKLIEALDEDTFTTLIIIYKAMRYACLELKYGAVFPYHEKVTDDVETEPTQIDSEEKDTFSWVKVHQNLLGDQLVEEDKFLKLNIHIVLNRLNKVIIDNRKRKR
jgi:hypothetical protein